MFVHRPGRLDQHIFMDLPMREARVMLLNSFVQKIPLHASCKLDDIVPVLVQHTEGFSIAELENLVREAVMISLREDLSAEFVEERHFMMAIKALRG
jgi:transitional endoplasmic reticulum ATPase